MIVSSGCNSNSRNDGVKCTNDRAGTLGPTSGRKTPIERKVAASFVGAVREPPEIRALLEAPYRGHSHMEVLQPGVRCLLEMTLVQDLSDGSEDFFSVVGFHDESSRSGSLLIGCQTVG